MENLLIEPYKEHLQQFQHILYAKHKFTEKQLVSCILYTEVYFNSQYIKVVVYLMAFFNKCSTFGFVSYGFI